MEHEESAESMAVERYLLNEMLPEEREAFEEHFFGCATCAADLRAGVAVAEGVRGERRRVETPTPRKTAYWPAVAAAALIFVWAGYQYGVAQPRWERSLSRLRAERDDALQPRVVQIVSVRTSVSRGGDAEAPVVPADRPFVLSVDLPAEPGATGYALTIIDSAGVVRARFHAASGVSSVQLLPGRQLPAGHYTLNVTPEPRGQPVFGGFDVR